MWCLLFIVRVKAPTPDRSNKWKMTSNSCSKRSTSSQVGDTTIDAFKWQIYWPYSNFLVKPVASNVLTGWVFVFFALTGIKESDTGLAPPALWDLAADKQTLQSEQPLQVAR